MLIGKHIAITGALDSGTRAESFARISAAGGIPQKSVTHETDYLVVGHYRPGTPPGGKESKKHRMAIKYGVQIIGEEELMNMVYSEEA